MAMDILEHNRRAWNQESSEGSPWSTPVSDEIIRRVRAGDWQVILTPVKAVPREWLGDLKGKEVLCLASAGGQQAPVLAAAGARVISFDLSDVQLQKDRDVAERNGLSLECIRGDMADLSSIPSQSVDLVFHPVSNVFVPALDPVWQECYRVLRPGGSLLAGFMNPAFFLFDHDTPRQDGRLEIKYHLPYAEPESLDEEGRRALETSGRALQFGHSLEAQIGGQLRAGFALLGLYEDYWTDELSFNAWSPSNIATRAVKLAF